MRSSWLLWTAPGDTAGVGGRGRSASETGRPGQERLLKIDRLCGAAAAPSTPDPRLPMHVPTGRPPTPSAIATIGVYGFAGNTFLERLSAAAVRLVLDVRQRRGVRDRSTRGPTPAPAGRPRRRVDRLSPPPRARPDDRAARTPVRRGRPARCRQALPVELAPSTSAATRPRSSTALRHRPRHGAARRGPRRAPLRRARPRGLPPLPHRRSFRRPPRLHDRAPAPLTSPRWISPALGRRPPRSTARSRSGRRSRPARPSR